MKKNAILLYTILSLLFFGGYIQESSSQNTDSLWKVYSNKTQADTNRLKAIQLIVRYYASNNPDTAIILAGLEMQLANELP